jgi:phosphate/sulfate permease
MVTIGAADMYGLPVNTTHILTSGVAGTMRRMARVCNGGPLKPWRWLGC